MQFHPQVSPLLLVLKGLIVLQVSGEIGSSIPRVLSRKGITLIMHSFALGIDRTYRSREDWIEH